MTLCSYSREGKKEQVKYCELKKKRDLASCGAIGGQFGQNITTRELFYSPMGFYCSRRFMSVVPSETIPRHSQYLAHTDSHNQRAVSAVLSLRRLTYLGCRFTCGADFRGFAACGFGLSPYLGKPPHARKNPLVNLVPRVLSNPPYGRAGRRDPGNEVALSYPRCTIKGYEN